MNQTTQSVSNYILRVEYLGFRFHGWQFQPGHKTVEGMLRKTIRYVLPNTSAKILSSGRTDAMVSALDSVIQLNISGPIPYSLEELQQHLNQNLPADIRIKSIEESFFGFNAIRDSKLKTYSYYFCSGPKPHPFCAPFFAYFPFDLDMELMTKAACLFEGSHDFGAFTARLSPTAKRHRNVIESRILPNQTFTASFFPEQSFQFQVRASGFGRHQIRLMMGALVAIACREAPISQLELSLSTGAPWETGTIAPASGLMIKEIELV